MEHTAWVVRKCKKVCKKICKKVQEWHTEKAWFMTMSLT
ncbi:hypothetical protein C806_03903 [Lachnospiraceae bacterium 3-1]|nr:hypothetical protein C806_03903 [Lachnospiraceae bacterium 3-1]